MSDLASLIEARLMELLDSAKEPECKECGRKPMTPTQTTQALRVAIAYQASKQPAPDLNAKAPGSGFKEEDDDE